MVHTGLEVVGHLGSLEEGHTSEMEAVGLGELGIVVEHHRHQVVLAVLQHWHMDVARSWQTS